MAYRLQTEHTGCILTVSLEGEFIWHPNAKELIERSIEEAPNMAFILQRCWDYQFPDNKVTFGRH